VLVAFPDQSGSGSWLLWLVISLVFVVVFDVVGVYFLWLVVIALSKVAAATLNQIGFSVFS
jgi:hypothetical protein